MQGTKLLTWEMVYWNLSMQLIKTDDDTAFFHNSPPTRLSNPWHLCAPELLFSMLLDKSVDMWTWNVWLVTSAIWNISEIAD